jgi:hypothetical protein
MDFLSLNVSNGSMNDTLHTPRCIPDMQICLQLFATMNGGEYGMVCIRTISEGDKLYIYVVLPWLDQKPTHKPKLVTCDDQLDQLILGKGQLMWSSTWLESRPEADRVGATLLRSLLYLLFFRTSHPWCSGSNAILPRCWKWRHVIGILVHSSRRQQYSNSQDVCTFSCRSLNYMTKSSSFAGIKGVQKWISEKLGEV